MSPRSLNHFFGYHKCMKDSKKNNCTVAETVITLFADCPFY